MIRQANARAAAFATLLVLAPLPFGGTLAPFATWLLVAAAALLAFHLLRPADATELAHLPAIARVAVAVAAIGAFGWLQALPLPPALSARLAPRIVELRAEAAATSGTAGETLDSAPLSLAPGASRDATFDWFLPAIGLAGAALAGAGRRSRRVLFGGLLAAALVQLAIGIQLWIARSDSLWGIRTHGFPNRLRGSFVNPNHLALFFEMALAVAFAWLAWSVRRSFAAADRAEARLLRLGPPALLFLLLFAGLVLTGSRAGALAAGVALAVQGYLLGRRRGRAWLLAAGGIAVAAGIAFVLVTGVEGSLARLVATPLDEAGGGGRLRSALATFELWRLSPLTGVGLGAFRAAFPLVQPETLPGLWRHAHSDWVELLATTGLVGAALLSAALLLYLRRLRVVVTRGERSEDRAAGIAAAGALVAVALHSAVDFGLTMPANAFALAVVAGAGVAAKARDATAAGRSEEAGTD